MAESISKGANLALSKEIPIKETPKEDEPSRAESKTESFKTIWNKKIENHVKRENKMEENVKKAYTMIFKEFYPSQIKNIIKDHPKYDSIINDPLKIMDATAQSTDKTIRETYPYLSLK